MRNITLLRVHLLEKYGEETVNPPFVSQEYLDEVRKRCDSATPAPWVSFVEGRDHSSGSNVIVRGPDGSEADLYLFGGTEADHDFVANARQDIPLLLDEIIRLRKQLETSGIDPDRE